MNIKGAIFDLDGTLLDSMRMWRYVGNDYLLSIGLEPSKTLHEELRHMYLLDACDYICKNYDTHRPREQVFSEISAYIADFYKTKAQLKEGSAEYLEKLKKDGVRICLATATERKLLLPALKRCGILNYFENIFTCYELKTRKTEPLIYNTAHAFLKTPVENTYVFEDVFAAAQTAKGAGFKVVGVYDSMEYLKEKELKEISDMYINSFKELL